MSPSFKSAGKYATAESRWAGVGPYYAMFPASFAARVVVEHSQRADTILDPFAGRGTSLFAAASEGRIGLGIEINPVGWVYGKAKLQPAERESVEERIRWIGQNSHRFRGEAAKLPEFFHHCYCRRVREFLVAARALLDWRRNKCDWTTAALLLVDLHGKRESALSNQMRQTKSMSPPYALRWWRENSMKPPERDPVQLMLKKIQWRYAKGTIDTNHSRVYFGDSRTRLRSLPKRSAALLFTSPPYHAVTNYFYDQWLRLWLLGGPSRPRSLGSDCTRKFESESSYAATLKKVFAESEPLLRPNAVIFVRTGAGATTREATLKALEQAFPKKKIRTVKRSNPTSSQTSLFHSKFVSGGELDLVMW